MTEPLPGDPGDADNDNWAARYTGLQKVLSVRDRDLAAAVAERDTLKAESEALKAEQVELEEFRAAKAALDTEQAERAQYEALAAKYDADEPEPPEPQQPNVMSRLGWKEAYERKAPEPERTTEGWPI